MSLLTAGGLDWVASKGPFPPKPFYHSVILKGNGKVPCVKHCRSGFTWEPGGSIRCCFWDWDAWPSAFLLPAAALAQPRELTDCRLTLSPELDRLTAGLCLASALSCRPRETSAFCPAEERDGSAGLGTALCFEEQAGTFRPAGHSPAPGQGRSTCPPACRAPEALPSRSSFFLAALSSTIKHTVRYWVLKPESFSCRALCPSQQTCTQLTLPAQGLKTSVCPPPPSFP